MGLFTSPLFFFASFSYVLLLISQYMFDSLEVLWIFMELLTFVLIGLIFTSSSSSSISFSVVSYFITQSILSMVILVFIILSHFSVNPFGYYEVLLLVVILANLGSVPFSGWYYTSVVFFPRYVLLLSLTIHKIPLLYMVSLVTSSLFSSMVLWEVFVLYLVVNLVVSAVMALTSLDIYSVVLSTSISNNSWLLLTAVSSVWSTVAFILVYFIFLSGVLSSSFSVSNWSLVAVSGLPPFPMFFIKLGVMWFFFLSTSSFSIFLLGCVFMLGAFLVSFSYMRVFFSRLTLSYGV